MLIRPDVIPDKAGARGKLVPTARGRKVYSCMNFLNQGSNSNNNNQLERNYIIFVILNISNLTKSALLHDSSLIVIQGGGKGGLQFIFILFIHYCTIKQTTVNLFGPTQYWEKYSSYFTGNNPSILSIDSLLSLLILGSIC